MLEGFCYKYKVITYQHEDDTARCSTSVDSLCVPDNLLSFVLSKTFIVNPSQTDSLQDMLFD